MYTNVDVEITFLARTARTSQDYPLWEQWIPIPNSLPARGECETLAITCSVIFMLYTPTGLNSTANKPKERNASAPEFPFHLFTTMTERTDLSSQIKAGWEEFECGTSTRWVRCRISSLLCYRPGDLWSSMGPALYSVRTKKARVI